MPTATPAEPNRFAAIEPRQSQPLLTWRDVSDATDAVIARTNKTLDLFDRDLLLTGWQSLSRFKLLRDAIVQRSVTVRLMLCDTTTLRGDCPRVVSLLSTHAHKLSILGTRNQNSLNQSLVVADGQHLIFRPNMVQSSGSLEFENPSKSIVWITQFEVTWQQGGRKIFAEALGL
ncbi:MAG: hypothetical protein EAZ30_00245 [Betaproteobacteria bacterium]|nr:MAG: hypothetical protein EAZ30_00245 [Betaproteobacteria bacterium]